MPLDARVAATDPNDIVAKPLPLPLEQSERPRVRVISPTTTTDDGQTQTNSESDEQTAAVSEDDGRPKWQRKRTRRFKQAPKGTEILDTSRPTYAVPISPIKPGLKTGARLRQSSFALATYNDVDLSDANLSISNLFGARFNRTNFSNANLQSVSAVGTFFGASTLSGANLTGANLSGADLKLTRGLTQAQLNRACGDDSTQLPKGKTIPSCS